MSLEATGIIASTRFKIESALKEKKAFDENSATDLKNTYVNFLPVLDIMEQSGLIGKTLDGRVFMTKKGQEESRRGFTVINYMPSGRKFIRFSRNK
ncbi:MAG: hypothetical protein ACQCN4_04900 [Candidatus Bathyarchaeia archaeon]|jgi:hypothetical protein